MRWLGTASALPMKNIPPRFDICVFWAGTLLRKITPSVGHHRRHADFGHDAAPRAAFIPIPVISIGRTVAVAGIDCLRIVHLQVGAVAVEAKRDRVRAQRSEEQNCERRWQRP